MHTSLKCYKENLVNLFALEKKIQEFNEKNVTSNAVPSSIDNPVSTEEDLVRLAEGLMDGTPTEVSASPIEKPKSSLLDENATELLEHLKSSN